MTHLWKLAKIKKSSFITRNDIANVAHFTTILGNRSFAVNDTSILYMTSSFKKISRRMIWDVTPKKLDVVDHAVIEVTIYKRTLFWDNQYKSIHNRIRGETASWPGKSRFGCQHTSILRGVQRGSEKFTFWVLRRPYTRILSDLSRRAALFHAFRALVGFEFTFTIPLSWP